MTDPAMSPLDLLLGVYFHQDWDVDASTAGAIVDSFAENEPAPSSVRPVTKLPPCRRVRPANGSSRMN
jgi:hypothetical protein